MSGSERPAMSRVRALVNRWLLLIVGVVLGATMAVLNLVQGLSPDRALVTFSIVAGWSLAITLLRSRSETASALAGKPVDERWQAINLQAAAAAAQIGVWVALFGLFIAGALGAGRSRFRYRCRGHWFRVHRRRRLVPVAKLKLDPTSPAAGAAPRAFPFILREVSWLS